MANANRKSAASTSTKAATATATMSAAPSLAAQAAAVVTPAAPTVRHYGASAAVLATGALPPTLTKYGTVAYTPTARGVLRIAGSAAKATLGAQYPAYATLAATLAANGGSCTAQQFWDAVVAAGQNVVSTRAFSKKGSTICPSRAFSYMVAQGYLVAQ